MGLNNTDKLYTVSCLLKFATFKGKRKLRRGRFSCLHFITYCKLARISEQSRKYTINWRLLVTTPVDINNRLIKSIACY